MVVLVQKIPTVSECTCILTQMVNFVEVHKTTALPDYEELHESSLVQPSLTLLRPVSKPHARGSSMSESLEMSSIANEDADEEAADCLFCNCFSNCSFSRWFSRLSSNVWLRSWLFRRRRDCCSALSSAFLWIKGDRCSSLFSFNLRLWNQALRQCLSKGARVGRSLMKSWRWAEVGRGHCA